MTTSSDAATSSERLQLLAWYGRHSRDLPWRRDRDPYRVWISEIMLQQTRVETVLPYYDRFLDNFPSVEALAAALVEEVLALWSGLGYYRRARQMHAAAVAIAESENGFPTTYEGLLKLPGIGPYTAAAVGSIAFGLHEPVLDGNVERVLSRVLALSEDPKSARGRELLRSRAAELLSPGRPGDSNQALMELGATLCRPKNPKCLLCPLESGCRGRLSGQPERFPTRRPRKRPERVRLVAALAQDGPRILLFRRAESSKLLAGIWEVPWVEVATGKSARASQGGEFLGSPPARSDRREDLESALTERYGGRWSLAEAIGEVRHSVTFRALLIEVRTAFVKGGDCVMEATEAGWFESGDLRDLPLSSATTKILKKHEGFLRGEDRGPSPVA